MAYYNKYKFTFATRSNKTAYLYLQEDLGSAPTVIEYPGKNLNLQYIPNSDDPFEPIFASQLGVSIDVTDDISNIPDLTTLNDRKYFAKLYLDATLEWCGWVLSDGASISYSTGRKMMSFNAIDGLGMLDKIPLPIANTTDINAINTLLYFIRLCLNSNGFPINPNIMTVCSYYATGMTDRTTNSYSEPFNQAYLPYRTFIETGVTYISCLQVLSNIVKSFGCRLFQAGGKWWIVAVNQFANQNNWYTEYTYTGTVAASGSNLNTLSTIQAYTGNTSRLYFIDNSQTKLLKKGFNRIEDNYEIKMTPNYFSNGNFRPYVSAQASNWQAQWNGGAGNSVTIIDNPSESFATYRLDVNNSTGSTAWVETHPSSLIKIPPAVALEISWIFQGQDLSASPRAVVYLTIADAVNVYYWNGTIWTTSSQWKEIEPYTGTSGGDINSYSFKTDVTPIAGSLKFKFALQDGTGRFAAISNIKLAIASSIKSQSYYSYKTANLDYIKTIDIPYGAQTANETYPSEIGMFVLSNNVYAGGWYEYGGATTYGSLLLLLMQKYMNVYGKNIINLDCDLSSFSTTNGILNASKLFKATDTDPSPINISSNSYMLGNSTTDYAADRTNATLLQISNTTISATNGYLTSFNDLI